MAGPKASRRGQVIGTPRSPLLPRAPGSPEPNSRRAAKETPHPWSGVEFAGMGRSHEPVPTTVRRRTAKCDRDSGKLRAMQLGTPADWHDPALSKAMSSSNCRCQVSLVSGQKPEFKLAEAVGHVGVYRPFSEAATIRHHLQIGPQLGIALLYFISYFTALENGKSWIGKVAPCDPLQLFQRVYVAT